MSLHIVPVQVNPTEYRIFLILSDEAIARIRQYDPAEMPISTLPLGFADLKLLEVIICYATEGEMEMFTALAKADRVYDAIQMITRGYQVRPSDGPEMLIITPKEVPQ